MIADRLTPAQLRFADRRSAAQRTLCDVRERLLTLERQAQEFQVDRQHLRVVLVNLAALCSMAADACPHGDVHCPCQDGDACHYEDAPGTPAAPSPMCHAQHNRVP